MLGYNTETFCSQVLSEGLPEIFASHEETNSPFLFAMLEAFSQQNSELSSYYKRTSFLEAPIKAKSGYVKRVRVQVHFLMSFQNDRYESDMFFHIIDQGLPYHFPEKIIKQPINKDFIEAIQEIELQAKMLMRIYYNQSILSNYSNIHRVCSIKEL